MSHPSVLLRQVHISVSAVLVQALRSRQRRRENSPLVCLPNDITIQGEFLQSSQNCLSRALSRPPRHSAGHLLSLLTTQVVKSYPSFRLCKDGRSMLRAPPVRDGYEFPQWGGFPMDFAWESLNVAR
ncbi:hypothetical protein Tco_0617996 [Tanacetum coccineum]